MVGVGRAVAEGVVAGGLGLTACSSGVTRVQGQEGQMVVDVGQIKDVTGALGDGKGLLGVIQ